MAVRFYILPMEVAQVWSEAQDKYLTKRGPKYLPWRFDPDPIPALAGVRWSILDYGVIETALAAVDVTPAQHTALAAFPDVIAVPSNLDSTVGATKLAATRAAIETLNIPGNWVQASDTYRVIVRQVSGMFLFMQRLTALTGQNPFTGGLQLNAAYSDLPLIWRESILGSFRALYIETPFLQWVKHGSQMPFGQLPEFLRVAIVSEIQAQYAVDISDIAVDELLFADLTALWKGRVVGIAEAIFQTPAATVGLTASSTIRAILKAMSEVWGTMPIKFGNLITL